MDERLIRYYNRLYKEKGFDGIIDELNYKLEFESVIEKGNGLYCIITCGWSDNEAIVDALTHMCSLFGNKHYVGYLCGGAYYFAKDIDNDFEITLKKGAD